METQDIRREDEVHGRIKTLTHQTLLSLLRTYDHESNLFYGSVQNNRSTPGTWRDSALVLMALQQGVEAMRRDRRKAEIVPMDKQDDWTRLEEDFEKNRRKFNEGRLIILLRWKSYELGKSLTVVLLANLALVLVHVFWKKKEKKRKL